MLIRNRIAVVFCVVQLLGIACSWLWDQPPSAASSFLWGTGFFVLFPGNILAALIIEKLFWHSSLSLPTMGAMTTVLLVAINALIWLLVIVAIRAARALITSVRK
jgi:hypothetical protein